MAYNLGQFSQTSGVVPDGTYMKLIKKGTATRKQVPSSNPLVVYYDQCITLKNNTGASDQPQKFLTNQHYYFHGKIKKQESSQQFDIKLVSFDGTDGVEQYIKTITVAPGHSGEWQDIEFIFTSFVDFDTILFNLKRTATTVNLTPVIAYIELSQIQNAIGDRFGSSNLELFKIGVQSHPYFLMCINGEEIRTYRSGIFEIKNEAITIDFFSVVKAAEETTSVTYKTTESDCYFSYAKQRTIDGYIIDYLYES